MGISGLPEGERNSVGRGIQDKVRCSLEIHAGSPLCNLAQPGLRTSSVQLGQGEAARGTGGKKTKSGRTKGRLAGGWEGQKEARKGERLWGLSVKGDIEGKGNMKCPPQVLAAPSLVSSSLSATNKSSWAYFSSLQHTTVSIFTS